MALKALLARPRHMFYGWWVVIVSYIMTIVGGGFHFYGFTVLFLPISRDLQLSRAATSLVFSFSRAHGAVEGPLAGWFIDKYGPRLAMILGIILAGVGYIILSRTNNYLGFLLVYILIISLGYQAAFVHAPLAAVNNWFSRRRALTMAIVTSAWGAGGGLITPLYAMMVREAGWRTAVVWVGITFLAVALPLSLAVKRSPESMGLRPDGDPENPQALASASTVSREFTTKQGLRTASFWLLVGAASLQFGAFGALMVHFVPLMVWKGTSEAYGAFLLGALSLLSVPMRITFGWLGDRWSKPMVLALGMGLGAISLFILLTASAGWQLWLFIVSFAVVEGINTLNWAVLGDYFGRKSFATLRGVMTLCYSGAMAALPVFAGLVYDRTLSYSLALWVFIILFILSGLLYLRLRPPKET